MKTSNRYLTISVKLEGLAEVIFDRCDGNLKKSQDKTPAQKLYLTEKNEIVFPAINVDSLISGQRGAAKFFEGKKSGEFIRAFKAYVNISPVAIPFSRDGKNLIYNKFNDEGYDDKAGLYCKWIKSQPNPKAPPVLRHYPVLKMPWDLKFNLTMIENDLIGVELLETWLLRAGHEIGIGTLRPRNGKFSLKEFEIEEQK